MVLPTKMSRLASIVATPPSEAHVEGKPPPKDSLREIHEQVKQLNEEVKRIADVLEAMQRFFIATSVEEVEKRVQEMHEGRR